MAAPMSRGSVPEPGAAPYGNFPNYSRFHPPEGRVSLLPQGLLRSLFPAATRPLLGLDVGCNSGVRGRHAVGANGEAPVWGYWEHWGGLAASWYWRHWGTVQPMEDARDEALVWGGADWEHWWGAKEEGNGTKWEYWERQRSVGDGGAEGTVGGHWWGVLGHWQRWGALGQAQKSGADVKYWEETLSWVC